MAILDIQGCLDAGKCLVMKKATFYILIGMFSFAGLVVVILFAIAFFTPALIFLKAKVKKSPLLYVINRGQRGRFVVGKLKTEGIIEVNNVGPFIITENSHTIEHKSGIPLFFAFGEYAASLPLRWVYVLNKIRQRAIERQEPITNSEDLGKEIGLKYDDELKVWKGVGVK